MEDSINLSVSSLPTETDSTAARYKRAAKMFLNKKFDASFAELEPLLKLKPDTTSEPPRLWTKIWSLYMAILDKAVNDTSQFPKSQRKMLQQVVQDNTAWEQVETAFNGLDQANPDLVLSLVTLSTRNCGADALKSVNTKLEAYISSAMDGLEKEADIHAFTQLVHAYATKLLPKINEFEYAKEFVSVNPFISDKQHVLGVLDQVKSDQQQAKRERQVEEKEQARLERDRVLKAEQQQFSSTPSLSEESDLNVVDPAPLPTPTSSSSAAPPAARHNPRDFTTLVSYWKGYISNLFKSASFLKILLFFVIILLSVTNPIANARIRRVLASIWTKLVYTIRMGTKVSYV